jgi:hypothetical protein
LFVSLILLIHDVDNSIFNLLFSYPGANVDIHFIPKTQRADSIPNMQSIIAALDGVRP